MSEICFQIKWEKVMGRDLDETQLAKSWSLLKLDDGFVRFHYSLLSTCVYVLIFYNKKVKKGGKESGEARIGDIQTSWRNSALQRTKALTGGGFSIVQLASPIDREELMM